MWFSHLVEFRGRGLTLGVDLEKAQEWNPQGDAALDQALHTKYSADLYGLLCSLTGGSRWEF